MAKATKTLNPLHFEDLEPHRFEDMVRQLAYDFRSWRSLEALGRSGSDDGIDVFGQEILGLLQEPSEPDESATEAEDAGAETGVRPWVIQCKREKKIGPTKARGIVEDFFQAHGGIDPYGYILAAACDFSKDTREAVRDQLTKHGVLEIHFWGKGELEDMLLQSKNDHLLFAYFGISLQIRRRSMKTELRSNLTLKRKLVKELGGVQDTQSFKYVLIRDPRDKGYPFIQSEAKFVKAPRWRYFEFNGHQPVDHVAFIVKKKFAYVNWETEEWDVIKSWNDSIPMHPELFGVDRVSWDESEMSQICRAYWERHVPERHQAWAIEIGIIPYERILACDEIGDRYNDGPHLLVENGPDGSPFTRFHSWLESAAPYFNRSIGTPELDKKLSLFPDSIPDEREKWRAELAKKYEEQQKRK